MMRSSEVFLRKTANAGAATQSTRNAERVGEFGVNQQISATKAAEWHHNIAILLRPFGG
jgi:hypothetical protein